MISLLSRIFIKNRNDFEDQTVRRSYGMLCSITGIVLNVLLFAVKFIIGILAGAVSILADSYNNLSDAGSSILSLFGFKFAGKKADEDNPFGHGRIEYLAGLAIAFLIMLVGFSSLKESIVGIINNALPNLEAYTGVLAISMLALSILVKLYMVYYNTKIGNKINSTAMKTVGKDSITDAIANLLVLSCAILYKYTGVNLDSWCGALMSAFLIFLGFKAAKETVNDLLGKRPDKELVDKIYAIVFKYEQVLGVHDMVIHDYGPGHMMISLHVEVSGEEDVYLLHDIIDTAMMELDEELGCISVIHMDPICTNDERVSEARIKVAEAVKRLDGRITIHDFRMVEGPTHTNFIFDAVLPHDLKMTDAVAKEKLTQIITDNFENTFAVIKIEKSFI